MKKKIIALGIVLFLLVGCSMANTPSSNVEALLMKYQKVDMDINNGIDTILDEQDLTDAHRERYRKIIQKQYENLTYEIKDEKINGDKATVIVEVEVIDYKGAISDLTFDSSIYTKESFDEEKLNRLENASGKVKYTIELSLTKDNDDIWRLDALTEEQIKKIQGMY